MEDAEVRGRQPGLLEAVARGALGKGGLIALAALTACSTAGSADAPAPRTVEEAELNQPIGAPPARPATDQCGAGELQWLVGKPKSEIPVPVNVVSRRVTCTTCPVTEDFAPSRLNIFFNEQTQLVEQVRCG